MPTRMAKPWQKKHVDKVLKVTNKNATRSIN